MTVAVAEPQAPVPVPAAADNPVVVYFRRLSPGSRRSVRSSLRQLLGVLGTDVGRLTAAPAAPRTTPTGLRASRRRGLRWLERPSSRLGRLSGLLPPQGLSG